MDILTHAIVGAATGLPFGHTMLGAWCGILPDIVLGVKRRDKPNGYYNATHSLLFLAFHVSLIAFATRDLNVTLCVFLSLLSHLVLDIPTHGPDWRPTLFYPLSDKRYGLAKNGNGSMVLGSLV